MLKSKLNLIKGEYQDFYNQLLSNGRLAMKDTGEGFWGAADADEVFSLFKEMGLNRYRNFLDLGSGDGKVVLIASLFTKATGIEIDGELHSKAEEIKQRLGLKKAELINDNFLEHDVSGYDVIFLNPDKPLSRGIEHKLLKEMNGKLIHYGFHFHPKSLKLEKKFEVNGNLISVYVK